MATRRSAIRYIIALVLAVVATLFVFTACGSKQFAIDWQIDENVTVTAEGYSALPSKVDENTELELTVTPKEGYEISEVLRNNRTVEATGSGKYKVKISEDKITIKVTAKLAVKSLEVTQKPTKNTYGAGETLEKEGMEVKVTYGDGSTKILASADYRIVYNTDAGAFALGDKSFKVSYEGKESAEVMLDETVVARVSLDLDGAVLKGNYLETLQANADLKDVKNENGVISFYFEQPLTKKVTLPTANDMQKGENVGDYDFTGWTNGMKELAVGEQVGYTLKASFAANLVRLTKVYYELEENVPYLKLEGTFQLANRFFLFLYEGNDVVYVADEAGALEGTRGQAFTYKFDMRKLSDARTDDGKDFSGKWMDIKIIPLEDDAGEVTPEAVIGSAMDIDITRYPASFVDTSQTLAFGDYVYSFSTYTPDGTTASHLKAVFNLKPAEYSFEVSGGVDKDGNPTLTINGTASEQFEGQYARIDIESVATAQYGKIENGKWTVTFVLGPENFKLNTFGYMHFNIVETETAGKGDGWKPNTDNNLGNVACTNTNLTDNGDFAYDGSNGYLLSGTTLRIANADDTAVYYVGAGKWGGFIVYGRNENKSLEFVNEVHIALKVDDMENPTKVYYVFQVRAIGTSKAYTEEEIRTLFLFGNIDGSSEDLYECAKIEALGGGVYRVWYDITEYSGGQLWPNYYLKDEVEEGAVQTYTKFELRNGTSADEELYAIAGGRKFTIKVEYGGACVVPVAATEGEVNPESADPENFGTTEPEPAPEPSTIEYTLTDVDLVEENGKPYFVLKGTYTGGTKEELQSVLEAVHFDLETNANMGASGWNRVSNYPRIVETTDSGWTIKFDISSLMQPATPHFKSESGDIKLSTEHAVDGKSITVGGVEYSIFNKPENDDADHNFWGNVGLMAKDERMNGKSYTIGTANLVTEENKVYYTVVVTFTGFSADELAKLDEIVKFGDSGKTSDMYAVAKFTAVEGKENTYTFYFDITNRAVSEDMLYAHIFVYSASQDVKDPSANGKSVTLNGKTYSIKCVDGDPAEGGTWGMSNLFVSNAE